MLERSRPIIQLKLVVNQRGHDLARSLRWRIEQVPDLNSHLLEGFFAIGHTALLGPTNLSRPNRIINLLI